LLEPRHLDHLRLVCDTEMMVLRQRHLDLMGEVHLYLVLRRDVRLVGALQNRDAQILDVHQTLVDARQDAMVVVQVDAELRYLQRMDCYLRAEDAAYLWMYLMRMDYFQLLVAAAYLLQQVQLMKLDLLE
jgi:hypothetical protein